MMSSGSRAAFGHERKFRCDTEIRRKRSFERTSRRAEWSDANLQPTAWDSPGGGASNTANFCSLLDSWTILTKEV